MKLKSSLPKNNQRSFAKRQKPDSNQPGRLKRRSAALPLRRCVLAATLCCIAFVLSATHVARGQTYTVLQSFSGPDGQGPMGSVIISGSTLYGVTSTGGSSYTTGTSGYGTIFSINTDGSGFDSFYSFTSGTGGDQAHHGSLALSDSTLYGMTVYGGTGNGNVYSIDTNGDNYQNLYSFSSGTDGSQPHGDLIVSGSTLYGTTSLGGANNDGVVFSLRFPSRRAVPP